MDRRSYLISVFDDTLERIKDDAELLLAQKQSIAKQRLIPESALGKRLPPSTTSPL